MHEEINILIFNSEMSKTFYLSNSSIFILNIKIFIDLKMK